MAGLGQEHWQQYDDDDLLDALGSMQREIDENERFYFSDNLTDFEEERRRYREFSVRKEEVLDELYRRGITPPEI